MIDHYAEDTGREIVEILTNTDGSIVPKSGGSVTITWAPLDERGMVMEASATVDVTTGKVSYMWQPGDMVAGKIYRIEWIVTSATGKTITVHGAEYWRALSRMNA